MSGVLEQVPVEVGQQVAPGTNVARVADPNRLKAELRIAETQARDLAIGQVASVDTRNGIIPGKVVRINPAAQNGTVTVDVELTGELPRGARPNLSVDGTVELERLDNVLYVGRPAFGQENSAVGLFRLDASGEAARTQVQLGRSSVKTRSNQGRRERRRPTGAVGHVRVGRVRPRASAVVRGSVPRSLFPVPCSLHRGAPMSESTQSLIRLDGIKKVFLTDDNKSNISQQLNSISTVLR